jgi:hypothetical protein
MKEPLPKLISPEGGCVLDDRIEGPFDAPPPTPEQVRRGEAESDAYDRYDEERRSPDIKDQVEREKRARARYEETLAAIAAQYEKEVRERKPEDVRRADAVLAAFAQFDEERPSADDPDAVEKDEKAFANYRRALFAIDTQYKREKSERERAGQEKKG